jgi:response regulator of citrate/malate metabolism
MKECKALIVEDNPSHLEEEIDIVESLGHLYEVAQCQTEATNLVQKNHYHYIIMDIEIPARNGNSKPRIECGENLLWQLQQITKSPVIVIAPRDAFVRGYSVKMMRKGAFDVIDKPFPPQSRPLDKAIKDALESNKKKNHMIDSHSTSRKFTGGELVIYPDQVTLLGVRILGSKAADSEIKMLHLLAQKRSDGTYPKLSGPKIAGKCGVKTAISHLARTIREAAINNLKEHNIDCGRWDVLPEDRKYGYHLKDDIVAQVVDHVETPAQTDPMPENTQAARQKWIREQIIENDRELTTAEMANKWDCSKKTISRNIKPLESQGLIRRIGKDTWRKNNIL